MADLNADHRQHLLQHPCKDHPHMSDSDLAVEAQDYDVLYRRMYIVATTVNNFLIWGLHQCSSTRKDSP